jgi:hypothetical protein
MKKRNERQKGKEHFTTGELPALVGGIISQRRGSGGILYGESKIG